jgi:hypothetical protein
MPYQVEKMKKVVSAIAKEPATLNMANWVRYPGADNGVPIRELITKQGQYTPPPCGTTMCLGGHLAHERLKEMAEIGERMNPDSSTVDLAMEYVGLPKDDPDWADYYEKFAHIFTRTNIRTVNGLRSALRRRGLL